MEILAYTSLEDDAGPHRANAYTHMHIASEYCWVSCHGSAVLPSPVAAPPPPFCVPNKRSGWRGGGGGGPGEALLERHSNAVACMASLWHEWHVWRYYFDIFCSNYSMCGIVCVMLWHEWNECVIYMGLKQFYLIFTADVVAWMVSIKLKSS